jgi:hypothetical protein
VAAGASVVYFGGCDLADFCGVSLASARSRRVVLGISVRDGDDPPPYVVTFSQVDIRSL